MSENDPTDDELEREARQDVPLAYGGTRRHAPKLSNEPRGINLQEMRPIMQAERDAAEDRQLAYQGIGQNVSVLAARRQQVAPAVPPKPLPRTDDAHAWDRFVVAALAIVQSETDACAVADALLAERRRRFG